MLSPETPDRRDHRSEHENSGKAQRQPGAVHPHSKNDHSDVMEDDVGQNPREGHDHFRHYDELCLFNSSRGASHRAKNMGLLTNISFRVVALRIITLCIEEASSFSMCTSAVSGMHVYVRFLAQGS